MPEQLLYTGKENDATLSTKIIYIVRGGGKPDVEHDSPVVAIFDFGLRTSAGPEKEK